MRIGKRPSCLRTVVNRPGGFDAHLLNLERLIERQAPSCDALLNEAEPAARGRKRARQNQDTGFAIVSAPDFRAAKARRDRDFDDRLDAAET